MPTRTLVTGSPHYICDQNSRWFGTMVVVLEPDITSEGMFVIRTPTGRRTSLHGSGLTTTNPQPLSHPNEDLEQLHGGARLVTAALNEEFWEKCGSPLEPFLFQPAWFGHGMIPYGPAEIRFCGVRVWDDQEGVAHLSTAWERAERVGLDIACAFGFRRPE